MPNICASLLEHARIRPDGVALESGHTTTTYAQLCAHAGAMADELREAGVGPGSRVAVLLPVGAEFASTVVAVAALGATYVPIDVNHASTRSSTILTDARCTVVVLGDEQGSWTPPSGLTIVDAVKVMSRAGCNRGLASAELVEPGAGDPLYIMYTSGSTGSPKGVLVPHDAVVQLVDAVGRCLRLEAGLVWAATHSPAFDFSVWEFWGALLTGGTLTVATREQILDPSALVGFVAAQRVNIFSQTPSSFRRIVNSPKLLEAAARGHLRYIVFGGEMLPSDVVRAWTSSNGFSQPELVNMYGITETTVHTTWRVLDPEALGRPGCPIGHALPGRSVTVCDKDGMPVPLGTEGELYVGGVGIATGYLDDSELTEQRFVVLPTPDGPQRFYRSGDLGYVDERGDLHHGGRADRQVKIRGHRIAVEEVEAAVRTLPGVADAVVVATRRPSESEQSLVAYLVPAEYRQLDLAACARTVRTGLPAYMVPARFIRIPVLPLTPNGKIDFGGLPRPWEISSTNSDGPATGLPGAQDSDVEAAIAAAYADILMIDPADIGPDADFFLLGGDSIMATRVLAETPLLRRYLSLADLYRYPTVRELAESWERAAAEGLCPGAARHGSDAPTETFPLTRAQEGVLFEWFSSGGRLYQDAMLVRVLISVDLEVLAQHARDLGEAHPAARLRFDLDAVGEEVRMVPTAEIPVVAVDESEVPVDTAMAAARAWIAQSCDTPFSLTKDALFRIRVAKLDGGSFALAVIVHHVVCDGWSLNVFVRDLIDLARGTRTLADVSAQGPQHERILRALPELERRDIVALNTPVLGEPMLPTDDTSTVRVPAISMMRESIEVEIDKWTATQIAAFANEVGVPVKSVHIAAHLRAAGVAFGGTRVSCIPISGRPDLPGADRCVGYFVRSRLIAVPDHPETTAFEFVRRVWAAERKLMGTRFAPLADQLGTCGVLPLGVHMNFVDFHVLDPIADALLDLELFDENSFPLTIEVAMRGTRASRYAAPLLTVSGLFRASRLEQIAKEHLAALEHLLRRS